MAFNNEQTPKPCSRQLITIQITRHTFRQEPAIQVYAIRQAHKRCRDDKQFNTESALPSNMGQ